MNRKTHVVPTHLRTPETLLTIAGLNLSLRQFLLLLLGIAMSYNLWLHLVSFASLAAGVGQIVRFLLALLPIFLASMFAFLQIAGRTLDRWFLVWLGYLGRPRRFVWRSIRYHEPVAFGGRAREEGHDDEEH